MIQLTKLSWEDDGQRERASSPYPLRVEQLAFRQHEVYIAFHAFRDFIHNETGSQLKPIDGSKLDRESWGLDDPSTEPLVGLDQDVALTGHSFGGCTVVSLATPAHGTRLDLVGLSCRFCPQTPHQAIFGYPLAEPLS
jgi:hypothetical protein